MLAGAGVAGGWRGGADLIRWGALLLAALAWAVVLVVTGTYETLADYAMFAVWIFYGLMVLGLVRLRLTRPDLPRPYRMWGYPATAFLFLAVAAYFVVNTLVTRPGPSLAGLALMATGVRVVTRLVDVDRADVRIGMELELVTVPFTTDPDGTEVVAYAFRPVEGEG